MLGRIVTVAALAAGGVILSKQFRKSRGMGMSSSITESIEVKAPARTAYNQWTQFEEFPQFMDSVSEVRQLSDTRLHWRADIAGKEKEWEAEMTEQIRDALGAVRMQVRSNLKRFKDLIESRGAETGAWRGTVAQH